MKRITKRNYNYKHKNNIISEISSKKTTIEPGHIVRFNYKGKDVHEPRPMVLILNPNWKGFLHGLALRDISEKDLKKLAGLVTQKVSNKKNLLTKFKIRRKRYNISQPQKFYKRELKRYLNKTGNTPYRIYNVKGISSMNIIDYNFKDMA